MNATTAMQDLLLLLCEPYFTLLNEFTLKIGFDLV